MQRFLAYVFAALSSIGELFVSAQILCLVVFEPPSDNSAPYSKAAISTGLTQILFHLFAPATPPCTVSVQN